MWTAVDSLVQKNGKIGSVGKVQVTYRRGYTGKKQFEWVSRGAFEELVFLHELYSATWEAIHDPRIILSQSMRNRLHDELGYILLPSKERLLTLRPKFGLYRLTGRKTPQRAVRFRLASVQLAVVSEIEFGDEQEVSN